VQVSSKAVRMMVGTVAVAVGLSGATATRAQQPPEVTGTIQWGLWIDDDGCQHWWADGGEEGYMVPRRNPRTGKPVCMKRNTCLVEGTDAMFATDSAVLSASARARLMQFFRTSGAFGYAIYGHTDSSASDSYNLRLSNSRAAAVADVARASGAVVQSQTGFGERRPIASNTTAEGMARNRRVEVVCFSE
jgi:outer membrane protein OmpA-like peptidoglycan-associated protein